MFVVTWLIHTSRVDINAWICDAIPVNWFCMIFMMIVFSCKFARILEHCLEPIYCYLSWQFQQRICTALPWTFMKRKNLSSLVIYFSLVWAAFIANTDSEMDLLMLVLMIHSIFSYSPFIYLRTMIKSDINADPEGLVPISVLKVDLLI
jgi:hypothetical protein